MDNWQKILEYENIQEHSKWIKEIPYIPFKNGWKIQVSPPFGGAVARFRVVGENGNETSVYLDCYDRLGIFGEPYWEIHPHDGDVYRCAMNDVECLVKNIEHSLKHR